MARRTSASSSFAPLPMPHTQPQGAPNTQDMQGTGRVLWAWGSKCRLIAEEHVVKVRSLARGLACCGMLTLPAFRPRGLRPRTACIATQGPSTAVEH